jgi:hypothetical protein
MRGGIVHDPVTRGRCNRLRRASPAVAILPAVVALAACQTGVPTELIGARSASPPVETAQARAAAQQHQQIIDAAVDRQLEQSDAHRKAKGDRPLALRGAAPMAAAGVAGLMKAELAAVPHFEWPPPKPSGRVEIPQRLLLASDRRTTLGQAVRRLRAAMIQSGYGEHSVYRINANGVALVTRVERLTDDGSPHQNARWLPPNASQPFSVLKFVRGLVWSEPGHYRLIVFTLTTDALPADGRPMRPADLPNLQTGGLASLPKPLADLPFTAEHAAFALIYELRSERPGATPVLLEPGQFTALQHLQKATIWAALEAGSGAEVARAGD